MSRINESHSLTSFLLLLNISGSTQYDSLGHVWCGGKLWNGYDANTTAGAMTKGSILPIGERGTE
jgi:hypothetical protein